MRELVTSGTTGANVRCYSPTIFFRAGYAVPQVGVGYIQWCCLLASQVGNTGGKLKRAVVLLHMRIRNMEKCTHPRMISFRPFRLIPSTKENSMPPVFEPGISLPLVGNKILCFHLQSVNILQNSSISLKSISAHSVSQFGSEVISGARLCTHSKIASDCQNIASYLNVRIPSQRSL